MVQPLTHFPQVNEDVLSQAISKMLDALTNEQTPVNLAEYYNPDLNYTGATFAGLSPNLPLEITATDLLATSTLNVDTRFEQYVELLKTTDRRGTFTTAHSSA